MTSLSSIASVAAPHTAVEGGRPAAAGRALGHVLSLSALFLAIVIAGVLVGFGGWKYYRTPIAERGYMPAHRLLRPSGPVGLSLGILGAVSMLSTLPYAVRKRWRPLNRFGTTKGWLEFHVFFGVVGPVLVTLHTSFKFNGLISAGYWLMMTVWASGFVGRYLYVRIPKSIRGTELTRADIEGRLGDVLSRLRAADMPAAVARELQLFAEAVTPRAGGVPGALDLFFGELRVRLRLAVLRRHLRAMAIDPADLDLAIALASERAAILRRLAHLQRTKQLFELWHVFHRPLVYGMFAIVALHVAVALYLGYASVLLTSA